MKYRHTVICCLFLFILFHLIVFQARGQFYSNGQDPAGLKWMQLKGKHFQLIYPASFSGEAHRFAALLETWREPVSKALPFSPKPFPVIFHPYSTMSNGYVVWAPWRMEIFPLPPQDIDAEDWLTQLAIHEYRHIVQLQKLNQGFTRWTGFLVGEQGPGAISGLVPRWFLEGDAVHTETYLARGRRGLLPSFNLELRTILLAKPQLYPFLKSIHGSYKDFVPDYYQYGFEMVSWVKENYGEEVFSKAIDFTGRKPYLLYPFGISLKKATGLNQPGIYKKAMQNARETWENQSLSVLFPEMNILNSRKSKGYLNYQFPVYQNDTVVIAVRSGLGEIRSLVQVSKGQKEKRILYCGTGNMVRLSSSANQVIWTEMKPDLRWGNRSYSVIRRVDLSTGKRFQVTRKSRCFAPALSPDAKYIVAVEITTQNAVNLVLLNTLDGKVIREIPSPGNLMLSEPCWTDSTEIAVIVQETEGKSIWKLDLMKNSWSRLLPPVTDELGNLAGTGAWVLFRGGFSGISNLFAVNRFDLSLWQITSVAFGAANPSVSPDGKRMVFSNYTPEGYDIAEIPFDTSLWKRLPESILNNRILEDKGNKINQEKTANPVPEEAVSRLSNESKYRPWFHLFRIHSWLPVYADYDLIQEGDLVITPGFVFLGQNLLNTSIFTAGSDWRQGYPVWKATWTYAGFYPVFRIQAEQGGLPQVYRAGSNELPVLMKDHSMINTQIAIPLNLSTGARVQYFKPSVQWEYRNDWFFKPDQAVYMRGIHFFNFRIYGYRYLRLAPRDIAPRSGQLVSLGLDFSPFSREELGPMLSGRFGVFLPGLIKHHALFINYSFLNQFYVKSRYLYSGESFFPRGYVGTTSPEMHKWSVDYRFPLGYPDASLGTFFYLKRVRGELFSDYASGKVLSSERRSFIERSFFSYGGTLYSDFHLFRIIFPFSFGLRLVYIPEEKSYRLNTLIRIDLTDF